VRSFCVPLRERPRLSTPGVLGSGPSYVVSDHQGLLRPHPSVPQARDDFTAWPFIRRAFAVRVRLGDPRDLPYFRYRSFQACRRPYAGGFEVLSRCLAHLNTRLPRFVPESPPTRSRLCQQYSAGIYYFDAASFALCCGPSVCLVLLTGSGAMRSRVPHPAF